MHKLTQHIFMRIALAAIVFSLSAALPAAAQTVTTLPTLHFPTGDGSWGCWFNQSCTVALPAGQPKL